MIPWSIRTRLTLWFASVLGVVLLGLSAATWWALSDSVHDTIDEGLARRAQAIERFLNAPATPQSFEELREDLREYVALDAGWNLIRIRNAEGLELYRSEAFDAASAGGSIPPSSPPSDPYRDIVMRGRAVRLLASRVQVRGRPFTVEVAWPVGELREVVDGFGWAVLLIVPFGVAAAVAGGYWISRWALAPVDRIAGTARTITVDRLDSRLEVPPTGDELQRLSETLNAMLDRLEAAFREATRFTADASHELRTPVSLIRTSAEVALRKPRAVGEYRRALEEILHEAERTSTLVDDLLTLSRADAGVERLRLGPLDLNELLEAACPQVGTLCAQRGLSFETDLPGRPVPVRGEWPALTRLVLALADNAVKYTPAPGRVRIGLNETGREVVIEVADTGIGIGDDDLPKLFDRFYRADKARSRDAGGAGLGLSIARSLAAQHGGRIEVESPAAGGSVFRVVLPAAD